MKEDELFILSEETFADIVQQITPEQLKQSLPAWFELGRTQARDDLTLRDVLNYHAYDTAWVPDTYTGKTVDEVGDKYDGDLLGDDPIASYMKYSDAAIAAIRENYEPDLMVHYTYGDFPAREAITHITNFRVFRAYDFAKLIGADTALPEQLVTGIHEHIAPHIDEWRSMGIFKDALPVREDADAQAKLFALVGRNPDWRS